MDLMNPANPLNMVNPASPWYHVWNTTSDNMPVQIATQPVEYTLGITDWIALGLIGGGLLAVVVGMIFMIWSICTN